MNTISSSNPTSTSSNHLAVRSYQPKDLEALHEVYYQTGLMGESLAGTQKFNDRKLFNMLFFDYYIKYEPEHCFVLVNTATDQALGYIIGTLDSNAQEKAFTHKMVWRIFLRMFLVSWWRYPESYKQTMQFIKDGEHGYEEHMNQIKKEYPAHLHINLSPHMQSKGGGSLLMNHFLEHLRENKSVGVHLGTTNQNVKAVPFYQKHGFKIALEIPGQMWDLPKEQIELVFTKSLKEA